MKALCFGSAIVACLTVHGTSVLADPPRQGPAVANSDRTRPVAIDAVEVQIARELGLQTARIVQLSPVVNPGLPQKFVIPIGEDKWTAEVAPHSVRSRQYQVLQSDADGVLSAAKPSPLNTARGALKEVSGSAVVGGFVDGGFLGTIVLPDGRRWWIEPVSQWIPDAPAGTHVVYEGTDGAPRGALCTTIDSPELSGRSLRGSTRYLALLAIDAEYEFYHGYGSVARVQDRINAIINIVNFQYEREVDISHQIGTIIVRTAQNYNPSNPTVNMRQQFQDYWNAHHSGVARDAAVLFDGNGLGGQANTGTICNVSQAYAACGVQGFQQISYCTDVISHEVGHLWNACHCGCASPPFTMNPYITNANRFQGSPGSECGPATVEQIIAFRNSRTCLDTTGGGLLFRNDYCANPLPVEANSEGQGFGFSTFDSVLEGGPFGCVSGGSADAWFTFTSPCDGSVDINTCASLFDTVLEAYSDATCEPSAASRIACNDDYAPCGTGYELNSRITFSTVRGHTYLIRVGGFNGARGVGILWVNQYGCSAPAGDSCAFAIPVTQDVPVSFSTTNASTGLIVGGTRESFLESACAISGDSQIANDIWYRFVPACSGVFTISTCGSTFDTKIAVHGAGCPTGDNQAVACNDDWCGLQSSVTLSLNGGQQYLVRIGGYNGATGTGTLLITTPCPFPANFRCEAAQSLTAGTSFTGRLFLADRDGSSSCDVNSSSEDIWYSFTAPQAGVMAVTTCSTNDAGGVDAGIDSLVSIHAGCPGNTLNELACNNDVWANVCGSADSGSRRDAAVSVQVRAGQTVLIRITHTSQPFSPTATVNGALYFSPTAASVVAGPVYSPVSRKTYRLLSPVGAEEARYSARTYGGNLVTIENAPENAWVASALLSPGRGLDGAFIGLSDRDSEGVFAWQSGLPSVYTNWAVGEPNNVNNEDFAAMTTSGLWLDYPDYPATTIGSVVEGLTPVRGPIVNPSNGHVYYVLPPSSWKAAQERAKQLGGDLVTIDDAAENAWVLSNLAAPLGSNVGLWLGLTDQASEGTFGWISGTAAAYRNWNPGEPNNHDGIENYVQMLPSGFWNDASNDDNDYMARVSCGCVEVAPPIRGPLARPGSAARYYLLPPMTWEGAMHQSLRLGGSLATILDANENQWVLQNVLQGFVSDGVWIGLSDAATEGQFVWADGSSAGYRNWAPGEPNNAGGSENYAVISAATGQWNDGVNDPRLLGYSLIRGLVKIPCAADFNGSGSVSVQDIFDYLTAYFGSDPRADFNASGTVSVQDIFDFLAAYFAGCN